MFYYMVMSSVIFVPRSDYSGGPIRKNVLAFICSERGGISTNKISCITQYIVIHTMDGAIQSLNYRGLWDGIIYVLFYISLFPLLRSENKQSLGELFVGFFKYYAEGYRYEISQRSFARQPAKVSNILNARWSEIFVEPLLNAWFQPT